MKSKPQNRFYIAINRETHDTTIALSIKEVMLWGTKERKISKSMISRSI